MNELVDLVVQRTGLSQEDAQKAVGVVIDFLKSKLPPSLAVHVDSLISGGSAGVAEAIEAEVGGLLENKLGSLFGGSSKPA